jgi:hypothetical protein
MEELRNALHAVAGDPPPTRIDLDRLIDTTQRRTRMQYRLGALTGTAAVLAGALLIPNVLAPRGGHGVAGPGGVPPGCQIISGTMAPTPTTPPTLISGSPPISAGPDGPNVGEPSPAPDPTPPATPEPTPCDDVPPCPVATLNPAPSPTGPPTRACFLPQAVIAGLVEKVIHPQFPGWKLVVGTPTRYLGPDGSWFGWAFIVHATLSEPHQQVDLALNLASHPPGDPSAQCAEAIPPGSRVTCTTEPEGDSLLVLEGAAPPGTKEPFYQVADFRPGGLCVQVNAGAPATRAQLSAIVRDKEWNHVM